MSGGTSFLELWKTKDKKKNLHNPPKMVKQFMGGCQGVTIDEFGICFNIVWYLESIILQGNPKCPCGKIVVIPKFDF